METLKPIRTNSKVISEAIKKHVIQSLTTEEYEGHDNTTKTSLEIVANAFNSEYWNAYHKMNYKNNKQMAFISWLCGIPSCVNVSVWTEDILNFLESIGLPQPENKNDQDSFNLYMNLYTKEFTKLCKINKINF
jgi:hypothetical protein